MITISDALQAKLDAGATTLAWGWRITREDGAVLGFTDHDQALTFEGTQFEPTAGLSPGAMRAEIGLTPGRAAAFGAIDSVRIAGTDLDNGLYDRARVEVFRIDWSESELGYRAFTGEIASIVRTQSGFEAEIAGPSARLSRTIGRVFARRCDAELGDDRCKVNLTDPLYAASGTVAAAPAGGFIDVSGLEAFEAGWFAEGVLTWATGPNAGVKVRVRAHAKIEDRDRLTLVDPPAADVQPGDGFAIVAGCDKRAETCAGKFANIVNFRGAPFMPGNDFLLRHPSSEPVRDGGARAL